jgi:glycopeptide antibiotics resistance protein
MQEVHTVYGQVVWYALPLIAVSVAFFGIRRHRSVWHILGVLALASYALWIASEAFFPFYMTSGDDPLRNLYQEQFGSMVNLVPLRSFIDSFGQLEPWELVRQHGGNLLLLTPFTFFGPALWPRLGKWWRALLLALSMSLTIELVQLLLNHMVSAFRSVDIDDVIINTAGAMIGYGLFALWRWGRRRQSRLGNT